MSTQRLWAGRSDAELDARMAEFNDSIPYDIRMWEVDIRGSEAYARALAKSKIVTAPELKQILGGLGAVRAEFAAARFVVKPGDEDIHTAVERRLVELIGEPGKKLHTGRSRNDQVANDLRMYCLDEIGKLMAAVRALQNALVLQAGPHIGTVMPGYTHTQRGQPVTYAHWCLSYFWPLQRDMERLMDCARRTATLALGSGGLAGNPFGLDRAFLARELFGSAQQGRKASVSPAITENSMDGVSDRDFIVELLFCCSMIGVHISRLAEDVVMYSTAEFGFISLSEKFSTGSSIMPQKKNADSAELTRGKSGRLFGNLIALLTVLKGTPMTYNKDYQECQELLQDSVDTLLLTLPVMAGALGTLTVNAARMQAALDPAMLATDVAEYLVRKGLPFREAHHLAGKSVAEAERLGIKLDALTPAQWKSISPHFDAGLQKVFNFANSVNSRSAAGGTSAGAIKVQLAQAKKALKQNSTIGG